MDYLEQLAPQYEKKVAKKDLNQTDIKSIADVVVVGLKSGEIAPEDAIRVACDFDPSVVAKVFEVALNECGEETMSSLSAAFLDHAAVKENRADFGLRRYLTVGAVLLKSGNLPLFHRIFVEAVKRSGTNGNYERAGKLLQKDNNGKTLALLLAHTYSDWEEKELKWLNQWLAHAVNSADSEIERSNYMQFALSNGLTPLFSGAARGDGAPPLVKTVEESAISPEVSMPFVSDPIDREQRKETAVELYRRLGREIERMSQRDRQMQETIRQLEQEIREKEYRLERLKGDKEQLEEELRKVQMQLTDISLKLKLSERTIGEKDYRIAKLVHELEIFSQVGEIKRDQELSAFKEELEYSLRTDYDDYLRLMEGPVDPIHHQSLLDTVDAIFDKLRRKGITLGEPPHKG